MELHIIVVFALSVHMHLNTDFPRTDATHGKILGDAVYHLLLLMPCTICAPHDQHIHEGLRTIVVW